MGQDPKLTLILFCVALAVLMQGAAMVGIWLAIQKISQQVEGMRADVKQRLDPLAQSVAEILANSRDPVRTITSNLAEISRILRDRTAQVDRVFGDVVDRSRLQVIRVDQLVAELVQKVENTADVVQRQILGPIQEVSAVIKGLRSGLEFLFARRRRSPSATEATQDEQMFI